MKHKVITGSPYLHICCLLWKTITPARWECPLQKLYCLFLPKFTLGNSLVCQCAEEALSGESTQLTEAACKEDLTGTEPSSAHQQLRHRSSNCSQDATTQTFHLVFNSGTPLCSPLPGLCQQGHGNDNWARKIPAVTHRPAVASLYSAEQALSSESGLRCHTKGDNNQTGYREESCSGVWAEPGTHSIHHLPGRAQQCWALVTPQP